MPKLVSVADVAEVLNRILPLDWLYAIARLEGGLVYLLRPAKRRVVARNLAPFAKDDSELKRMTRRFFEFSKLRALLLLLFLDMKPEEWERHFSLEGIEYLDQALSEGRGAILLGSHLNSKGVFIAVMLLRERGYDVSLALPSEDELHGRTLFGRHVLRRSDRATLKERLGGFFVQFNVRPIVARLARNGVVAQTGDGWHSAAFQTVPFLGRSLPFTTGMLSVAQSTGAMVVPFNVVGEPPNLRAVLTPPFSVPKGEDPGADLAAAVATYAKTLEAALLENVVCWEYWLTEDALDTMAAWPERPLAERYAL